MSLQDFWGAIMINGYYAVDYQTHSFRSHDGLASIADQCARAVEIGLDEIGFSEHRDFDPNDPASSFFEYDRYIAEIEEARRKFGERLKIRAGVEIDYRKKYEPAIAEFLAAHPFDFVLTSVHFVDDKMLMTPEYNAGRTRRQAYTDYFAVVLDSVESGLMDILGHLEYANRRGLAAWGLYRPQEFEAELDRIFDALIARNIPLEINTAGLHQGRGVMYPTAETVAMYSRRGGKLLSIGADSHQPAQLAHAYKTAVGTALANGLTHVCVWQNRKFTQIPLEPHRSETQ